MIELTSVVPNVFINLVLNSTFVHFCRRLGLHGFAIHVAFLVHNFLERVILPALYDVVSIHIPLPSQIPSGVLTNT